MADTICNTQLSTVSPRSRSPLADAREKFALLPTGIGNTKKLRADILADLMEAKTVFAALDPQGQKTSSDMWAEFKTRSVEGFINEARKFFNRLPRAYHVKDDVAAIDDRLKEAEKLQGTPVGYRVLDKNGEMSDEAVIAEIRFRAASRMSELHKAKPHRQQKKNDKTRKQALVR